MLLPQDLRGTWACRWPADLARLARRPGLTLLLDSKQWKDFRPLPEWAFEREDGGLPWELERLAEWRAELAACEEHAEATEAEAEAEAEVEAQPQPQQQLQPPGAPVPPNLLVPLGDPAQVRAQDGRLASAAHPRACSAARAPARW